VRPHDNPPAPRPWYCFLFRRRMARYESMGSADPFDCGAPLDAVCIAGGAWLRKDVLRDIRYFPRDMSTHCKGMSAKEQCGARPQSTSKLCITRRPVGISPLFWRGGGWRSRPDPREVNSPWCRAFGPSRPPPNPHTQPTATCAPQSVDRRDGRCDRRNGGGCGGWSLRLFGVRRPPYSASALGRGLNGGGGPPIQFVRPKQCGD